MKLPGKSPEPAGSGLLILLAADILILGSFGKSVFKQVYPPALINREWCRIDQVDYYDIYSVSKIGKKDVNVR